MGYPAEGAEGSPRHRYCGSSSVLCPKALSQPPPHPQWAPSSPSQQKAEPSHPGWEGVAIPGASSRQQHSSAA